MLTNKPFNIITSLNYRVNLVKSLILFIREYYEYRKMSRALQATSSVDITDLYPILKDKTKSHDFPRIYIYHASWAARVLAKTRPPKHVDISSTIWFSAIVSSFIPIDFYDYRPADIKLSNLKSKEADLTRLTFASNSIKSISCMHTIEHIGLGRYGDKIDPEGDIKAIKELKRVTAVNGNLLIVLPVGQKKTMFNAHRIYTYSQILEQFSEFKLVEFALIKEKLGHLVINANPNDIEKITKLNGDCGCFWFKKIKNS